MREFTGKGRPTPGKGTEVMRRSQVVTEGRTDLLPTQFPHMVVSCTHKRLERRVRHRLREFTGGGRPASGKDTEVIRSSYVVIEGRTDLLP